MMSNRSNDLGASVDLKFDTDKIKLRVKEILNTDPVQKQAFMRHKKLKITLIAAVITLLGFATVFASGGLISYFNSDKAAEITNVNVLENHNEKIDISVSKYGYTLTLDNLAADDNFLHVFYTITSREGKIWENKNIDPFVSCRINGQIIGNENNNDMHGYYVDDYTYKTVMKYNISQIDVPEKFLFEMYSVPRVDVCSSYNDEYLDSEYLTLTADDKEKLMYIGVETTKSTIKTENVCYDLNQEFSYLDYDGNTAVGKITKAVFSPFGSQLVIHDNRGGQGAEQIMGMAMLDDNNMFLDVLETDIGKSGEITTLEEDNSVEFIKGKSDMKHFTLVPVKVLSDTKSSISREAGSYPLTYEINEYGKVVVTGVVINDGRIDVHYYKDGFVRHDPEFVFWEATGNSINFGEVPAVYYETHYDTNSYTASYYYDDYDENGKKPLPSDGSLSKETLEKRFTSLEVRADNDYTLDYDNAVTVDLK